MAALIAARSSFLLVALLLAGAGAATLGGVQDDLADANGFGGNLHAFVLATEFHGFFQREVAGLGQGHRCVCGGGAHVGELLLTGDVDVHIFVAVVRADDHTFVGFSAGFDEEGASIGQLLESIGSDLAGAVGDERTGCTALDFAGPGFVALGVVVGDAGAAGFGHEGGAETDEATCGNLVFHANPVGAGVVHVDHLTLACGHELGDVAWYSPGTSMTMCSKGS